jgi:site-specific DNA-methyltransferase (adenine-specific)
MKITDLIREFRIEETDLMDFLIREGIQFNDDGILPPRTESRVLDFIERDTTRLYRALQIYPPFYSSEDGVVKIFRDDAVSFLEKLPPRSVDIIVTDPAYSGMNNKMQFGNGRIVGQYSDKGTQNGKWFQEFEDSSENYSRFLKQCKRVLRNSTGHIYIMFDSFSLLSLGHIVRDYFDVKNIITWDKVNIGMGNYYRRRHEYIIFATSGNKRKLRDRTFPDVWQIKRIHNAPYPTQKPVELFGKMLCASAEDGYVVCDPFLGSGSAAIAALIHNCRFIGCDISEKSVEISRHRILEFINNGIDPIQNIPKI